MQVACSDRRSCRLILGGRADTRSAKGGDRWWLEGGEGRSSAGVAEGVSSKPCPDRGRGLELYVFFWNRVCVCGGKTGDETAGRYRLGIGRSGEERGYPLPAWLQQSNLLSSPQTDCCITLDAAAAKMWRSVGRSRGRYRLPVMGVHCVCNGRCSIGRGSSRPIPQIGHADMGHGAWAVTCRCV